MTPKEKAKELIDRFTFRKVDGTIVRFDRTKKCALICVDEILKENERINQGGAFPTPLTEYWKEIKKEIEKL